MSIINFNVKEPITYSVLIEKIEFLLNEYDFIAVGNIGKSMFDRSIPIIRLGMGEKKVIYIGSHHGSEWITTGILLKFINEYCELYRTGGKIYGVNVKEMFENTEINIVPMLNPDGVEISINGINRDNVLYERLLSMNNGSNCFTRWQSNGRGVDLNHNYNSRFAEYKAIESETGITCGAPTRYSGEYPESEVETGFLCNFIRFNNFLGAITLHSQGEEIYYKSGEKYPKNADRIAEYFSRLSGYKLGHAEGLASYGGFTDWFIDEFSRPSFTIECGKGENPLPLSNLPLIYLDIRRILFEAPMVISRNFSQTNQSDFGNSF